MNLTKEIKKIIDKGVKDNIFPSGCVGVYYKKENSFNKITLNTSNFIKKKKNKRDKEKIYYDLASLTKPLSTVLSFISLKKEGIIRPEDNIDVFFKGKKTNEDKKKITIENILTHSAGFKPHQPFFKELVKEAPADRNAVLFDLINKEKLCYVPGESFLYSDIGFMLLGMIVKETTGLFIDEYVTKKIYQPIGLEENLFFCRQSIKRNEELRFAPTENCPWRGRVLSGEVSDENCWALDGVAGHAGLFGDIEGVLDLVALILDIWKGRKSHPNIDQKDLSEFLRRKDHVKGSTWAMGFDTPSPTNSSSGKYFSNSSVGHLGFTGTSFWIDPERELAIVLLTNRVHPDRENELIKEFRPLIHDQIVELLTG